MVTESLNKKNVTTGSIAIEVGSDRLLRIPVPVGPAKVDEAVPMMEELIEVVLRHYNKGKNMNPTDVARATAAVAEAVARYQNTLTEEKYNGKARKPRSGN